MRRKRWILLITGLLVAVVVSWIWIAKPKNVDMASYAPADSLIYLESNRPFAVVETIAGTDAWKAFERVVGGQPSVTQSYWLRTFISWTGIGPVQSVVLARAQIAAVVTDLGATEEGETLQIDLRGSLIQTHTAGFRIKPQFDQALRQLAEKTYGVLPTTVTLSGAEFTEWRAPMDPADRAQSSEVLSLSETAKSVKLR